MRVAVCVVLFAVCVEGHGSSYGHGKKTDGYGKKTDGYGCGSSYGAKSPHDTASSPSCTRGWGDCSLSHCCRHGWTCYQTVGNFAQCRRDCSKRGWKCTVLSCQPTPPSTPAPRTPIPSPPRTPSPGGSCPDWRPHAGCGRCWATLAEVEQCSNCSASFPPKYEKCGICHASEADAYAYNCSLCAEDKYSGCDACFSTVEGAENCSEDGCGEDTPYAGCSSCHPTEEMATTCCEEGTFPGCLKCYDSETDAAECYPG